MTSDSQTGQATVFDDVFSPPSRSQWVEMAVAGLKSDVSGLDALQAIRRTTLEGIPLEVLYDDCQPTSNTTSHALNRNWDNRLYVACADPAQAATRIMQGLSGGVTSVELHTQSPAHIATALAAVQLDIAHISLRSASAYQECAHALRKLSNDQGIQVANLAFSINADPVSTALALGESGETLAKALTTAAEFTRTVSAESPGIRCLLVDSAVHQNAGASTVEELHAAIATATLYLEALLNAGMSVSQASKQIVFQLAVDVDVLLGIAKLRALRALWQHVLSQFDADDTPVSEAIVIAETSRRFHSVLEPWNNHLRNLCASTAAMIGGADTLLVHPHDTLLRGNNNTDTELGDRMARNTGIILERESGLTNVNDPMAGSYAIENLTQQIMQYTWESLSSTDTGEGWVDELLSGRWQTRLEVTHRQRVSLMQQEQRVAVGVNRFVQTDSIVSTPTAEASKGSSTQASQTANNTDQAHTEQPALAPALRPVREAESFEQDAAQETLS